MGILANYLIGSSVASCVAHFLILPGNQNCGDIHSDCSIEVARASVPTAAAALENRLPSQLGTGARLDRVRLVSAEATFVVLLDHPAPDLGEQESRLQAEQTDFVCSIPEARKAIGKGAAIRFMYFDTAGHGADFDVLPC